MLVRGTRNFDLRDLLIKTTKKRKVKNATSSNRTSKKE